MNDFLKNLRSSQKDQKQRQSGPGRKNINTSFQTGTERRKLSDRRSTRQTQTQNQYKAADNISDTLPFITENMSQIAACAERFTESHEKLVQAEIEKNKAVEIFLQSLNTVLTEKFLPLFEEEKSASPRGTALSDGNESNTRQSKEEVVATIKNMRKKRATFAEIALFLKEQGIPTFSGRGEWHAQTIHRLCK